MTERMIKYGEVCEQRLGVPYVLCSHRAGTQICQPCYFFMVPLKNRGRWDMWSDNMKRESVVHTFTRGTL